MTFLARSEAEGIRGAFATCELIGSYIEQFVIAAIAGTDFDVLLDEGFSARDVAQVVYAGVETADGVRLVLGGSPVEWVRAFESGRAS